MAYIDFAEIHGIPRPEPAAPQAERQTPMGASPIRRRSDNAHIHKARSPAAGTQPEWDSQFPRDRTRSHGASYDRAALTDRRRKTAKVTLLAIVGMRCWTRLTLAVVATGAPILSVEHVAHWLGGDSLIATVLVLVLSLFVVPFLPRSISHGARR